jgi:hypothetical protein
VPWKQLLKLQNNKQEISLNIWLFATASLNTSAKLELINLFGYILRLLAFLLAYIFITGNLEQI